MKKVFLFQGPPRGALLLAEHHENVFLFQGLPGGALAGGAFLCPRVCFVGQKPSLKTVVAEITLSMQEVG